VLTPDEADEILSMVRNKCSEGALSALIITHKFREVMGFCDEVTVLRHGKMTGEGFVRDLDPKAMSEMMMGKATLPEPAARTEISHEEAAEVKLVIKNLTADDDCGVQVLNSLSLRVRTHEIVGIAGVSGNGQRELVQVLAGQRLPTGGTIYVHGESYAGSRGEIRRHHFHVLPEMPLQNACVGKMSTAENLAFRTFDQAPLTRARRFVNARAIHRRAEDLISRYRIRPPWPSVPIGNLSGGNVQRAVLARELAEEVQVLIAANPCFGLDFKAVADIRLQIMQTRNRGAAVLLVSEDLDEILELADRVLVISEGKIAYETPVASADRQVIGRHMAGH